MWTEVYNWAWQRRSWLERFARTIGMVSYTSTTLKDDPHATCLQGCIFVKLSPRFGPFHVVERRPQVRRLEAGVLRTKKSITSPI